MTRFYYTLADIAAAAGIYTEIKPTSALTDNTGIEYFCADILDLVIGTESTEGKKLWQEYIWPNLLNTSIFYNDGKELDDETLLEAVENKIAQVYFWFKASYGNYSKLIALYTSEESNLMDTIKSTSLSKYNDTPQDGGDYSETDNHVSNATKVESETQGDTVINRLDEIRKKIRNFYNDWYKEFEKLFMIY